MVGVKLDKQTEERLEALAEQTGCSKSYYVREALQAYLEEHEDYLVALSRLKNDLDPIERSGSKQL